METQIYNNISTLYNFEREPFHMLNNSYEQEDNTYNFQILICSIALFYLFLGELVLLFSCISNLIEKHNILKEISNEFWNDISRLQSYFSPEIITEDKPLEICKNKNNLWMILYEMQKYVCEIENMTPMDKKTRDANLKKYYIRTNILTNKFKMRVYEKLIGV